MPGEAQFDPSITLVDEPLGSRDEPAPGLPFDIEGTPRGPLVLVRDGVTKAVTHDRASAAAAGAASTGHASRLVPHVGPDRRPHAPRAGPGRQRAGAAARRPGRSDRLVGPAAGRPHASAAC